MCKNSSLIWTTLMLMCQKKNISDKTNQYYHVEYKYLARPQRDCMWAKPLISFKKRNVRLHFTKNYSRFLKQGLDEYEFPPYWVDYDSQWNMVLVNYVSKTWPNCKRHIQYEQTVSWFFKCKHRFFLDKI